MNEDFNMQFGGDKIVVEENYGQRLKRLYWRNCGSPSSISVSRKGDVSCTSLSNIFMAVFLPHGYPHTVSNDYLQYQLWDSIQAFASSITGSISTHAILRGAGVGDKNASSLAATIAWLIKDGTSMVGRIVFSWLQGTELDSDCKKWRFFADVLNDVALLLDLISAYFKEHFMIIMCLSGVAKSIVGVAGGATRAALTQHQARQNNMADVSAKDGSQETLVNLAALICSLIILPIVTENHLLVWLLYVLMTAVHLLSNYLAVKSVQMETFNSSRFKLYMQNYINSCLVGHASVSEINEKECVLPLPRKEPVIIKLGASFHDATQNKSFAETNKLLSVYRNCNYCLTMGDNPYKKDTIFICLREATVRTQIEAMYQACLMKDMYCSLKARKKEGFLWDLYNMRCTGQQESIISLEEFTRLLTEEHFSNFLIHAEMSGWRTDVAMFNADLWIVQW